MNSENSGSTQKFLVPENSSQKFLASEILCIQPAVHCCVFEGQKGFLTLHPENSGSCRKILDQTRKCWLSQKILDVSFLVKNSDPSGISGMLQVADSPLRNVVFTQSHLNFVFFFVCLPFPSEKCNAFTALFF